MTGAPFFFSGWSSLVRILVIGVVMYAVLVLFLRITGNRSLASMNAFDFIVTVTIGSVFGRALTAEGVTLAEAVTAFALLLALQYAVGWVQVRSTFFKAAVTNAPTLLYFGDRILPGELRDHRVTEAELREAVRQAGFGSLDEVEAVIIESNGELSVVRSLGDGSAIGDVIQNQTSCLSDCDGEEPAARSGSDDTSKRERET